MKTVPVPSIGLVIHDDVYLPTKIGDKLYYIRHEINNPKIIERLKDFRISLEIKNAVKINSFTANINVVIQPVNIEATISVNLSLNKPDDFDYLYGFNMLTLFTIIRDLIEN